MPELETFLSNPHSDPWSHLENPRRRAVLLVEKSCEEARPLFVVPGPRERRHIETLCSKRAVKPLETAPVQLITEHRSAQSRPTGPLQSKPAGPSLEALRSWV